MKRLLVLVLLVPILALTMISCDADMRSSIAGFMGGFGGNVYSDAGLIVVNTAQAEAATTAIAALGTGTGAADTSEAGFGVTIPTPTAGTMLAPQTPEKQKELKDNLGDAFNSDKQKEKLLEDLKKPASTEQKAAAVGTVEVFNATLDALKAGLTGDTTLGDVLENLKLPAVGDGSGLTQGDMLALQLMTDLISNTVATLNSFGDLAEIDDASLADPVNKAKVLSIIDDALFVAEMAENLSGAASIDFTGQIDLGSLLDGLGNKGARSRGEEVDLTDAEDFLGTINALAPSIVKLMGITYNSTLGKFESDPLTYKSVLLGQQVYRSSMEQALKMIELSTLDKNNINSLVFDVSTLIKYALSVFITEHDAFWKVKKADGALTPGEVIASYLNATDDTDPNNVKTNIKLGRGMLESGDVLIMPDDLGTGLDYALWPGFLKTKPLPYYQAIVGNLIRINDLGGIALLSDQIKENFYNPDDDNVTGLSDWYDDLSVED